MYHILFIPSSDNGYFGFVHHLAVVSKLLWRWVHRCVGYLLSVLWDLHSEGRLPSHMVLHCNFVKTVHIVSTVTVLFHIPTRHCTEIPSYAHGLFSRTFFFLLTAILKKIHLFCSFTIIETKFKALSDLLCVCVFFLLFMICVFYILMNWWTSPPLYWVVVISCIFLYTFLSFTFYI